MAKKVRFDITSVNNREMIDSNGDGVADGGAYSVLLGKIAGQVIEGSVLTMIVHLQRGGENISDRELAVQVAHELIHAFAKPEWDTKVDNDRGWVGRVLDAAFGDQLSQTGPVDHFAVGFTPFQVAGADGGTLQGGSGEEAFVGSVAADTFLTGSGKAHIFSGEGDDVISLALGGDHAIVVDDSGYDTIALPQATSSDGLSMRWSADGQDLALYVNGHLEAVVAHAATSGVEAIDIGGVLRPTASIPTGTNTAPSVLSDLFEIAGTYQGYIGTVIGYDPDGDPIRYRVEEVSGAYADQPWRLTADGLLFADFLRPEMPGSEFTQVRLIASDGVDATEAFVTVRWGSAWSPTPEFSPLAGPDSPDWVEVAASALSADWHVL